MSLAAGMSKITTSEQAGDQMEGIKISTNMMATRETKTAGGHGENELLCQDLGQERSTVCGRGGAHGPPDSEYEYMDNTRYQLPDIVHSKYSVIAAGPSLSTGRHHDYLATTFIPMYMQRYPCSRKTNV